VTATAALDFESCYRAIKSRDRRFDGVFYTAVRTTGIYCRPSCPARTPAPAKVTFHPTAAAAQAAGYRACKRCLPDATPGSPDWDVAADVAGRAMRLISDGVVDRDGVDGLARRVGYTPRHLNRLLTQTLGAGPLALARARRVQTARVLIETTDLGFADVAFAAGFASVRQFNDSVREVYAETPTALRGRRGAGDPTGAIELRLAVRTPFAGTALREFLALRAVPGVERVQGEQYARTLSLPHGSGSVSLRLVDHLALGETAFVPARFRLADLRDTAAALERVRRLLDADCDPIAVDDAFAEDPDLGPRVRSAPGLRVPGHVDGHELAVRAVLGQQVTVAGARTLAARLVEQLGVELDDGTRLFPTAEAIAAVDHDTLAMPRSRARALTGLATALAEGTLALDRGEDRTDVRRRLLALDGIGPWTADYIAMRALGDPDVFLAGDVGVRHALGLAARGAQARAEGWRPWRSYALMHLWHTPTLGDRQER
jgi:AraC family transcriptional regulator of adaptative response / DNA-3-methyladenine glycosylase II